MLQIFNVIWLIAVIEHVLTIEIIGAAEVGPVVEIDFHPIEVVHQRECAPSGVKMGVRGLGVRIGLGNVYLFDY